VLPFYEDQNIPLLRVLTDRGTEFKGKREHHEYELYLSIEGIEHSKTQVRSPQSNGICERLHRTMQEEFYAIAFRKKLYQTLDDLQQDLDQWIQYYNNERPHSGRYCYGKTPAQTFEDSIQLAKDKQLEQKFENTYHELLLLLRCGKRFSRFPYRLKEIHCLSDQVVAITTKLISDAQYLSTLDSTLCTI
jgi:hypothetical protein